jgi:hypothetical protein
MGRCTLGKYGERAEASDPDPQSAFTHDPTFSVYRK